MQLGAILTFAAYLALIALWGSILVLYARRLPDARQRDPLVAALLVVLVVDAAKNVIESVYFGGLWGARFGFLPEWVGAPLEQPLAMAVPKVLNVGVAVFVLVRIIGGFFPRELQERQQRRADGQRLQEEMERSLALVQESEGRLQSLLESTSDVVAFWRLVDRDLVLESVNPAGRALLGFGDEAVGTVSGRLAPPSLDLLLQAALDTGKAQREEDGWLETAAGRRAVIRQVVPLPDEDGVVRRVASFTQDITALRERQADEEAHTRLESLGMLAGGVAHDFNNLLAILRADVDIAAGRGADSDVAKKEALEHADVTIERARDLVTQLLATAGKRASVTGAVDVGVVVTDTIRLMMPTVPKSVRLVSHVDAGAVVVGDRTQVQQIVLNLMHNAVDAASSAGGTLVDVRLEATDGHVVLTVKDDGAGIDPAVQWRIFEPFFTTKRGGRGLGLATVFGLARAHGGDVDVHSAPGQGATFTVRLPRAVGALAPAESPPPSPPPSPSPSPSSSWSAPTAEGSLSTGVPSEPTREATGLVILLIDDDDRVRRATRRLLERLGHRVVDVDGGAAGLAIDEAYDIAVVDVTMPDMDGPTTLVRLRERRPRLPAVLVTGRGDVGGDGDIVLTKPFDEQSLQRALQQGLDQPDRERRRQPSGAFSSRR
jgi:two-component system cell cycle sensor histidine kinase/response regulator CckA